MLYNFDKVVDRKGTNCEKWDNPHHRFGREDIIPSKIADMDFETPDFVIDALNSRLKHTILSYSFRGENFFRSFIEFEKRHSGWLIEPEWIIPSHGVMYGVCSSIQLFSNEGDSIVIQPPVYPEFAHAISNNNRKIVENPLVWRDDRYEVDFEDLEKRLVSAKIFLLCNPQNPTGKLFSRDELARIGELCLKHNVLIVSDEIHCDLTLYGNKHINIASISGEIRDITITAISPSKTFNMAGMATSVCVIPNANLRDKFNKSIAKLHIEMGNILGHIAFESAYENGDKWLKEVTAYLEKSVDYTIEFIEREMPKIRCHRAQATYLMWLDFRGLNMTPEQLERFVYDEAKVALYDGRMFGSGGEGFMRLNIATPHSLLKEILGRFKSAYDLL